MKPFLAEFPRRITLPERTENHQLSKRISSKLTSPLDLNLSHFARLLFVSLRCLGCLRCLRCFRSLNSFAPQQPKNEETDQESSRPANDTMDHEDFLLLSIFFLGVGIDFQVRKLFKSFAIRNSLMHCTVGTGKAETQAESES